MQSLLILFILTSAGFQILLCVLVKNSVIVTKCCNWLSIVSDFFRYIQEQRVIFCTFRNNVYFLCVWEQYIFFGSWGTTYIFRTRSVVLLGSENENVQLGTQCHISVTNIMMLRGQPHIVIINTNIRNTAEKYIIISSCFVCFFR